MEKQTVKNSEGIPIVKDVDLTETDWAIYNYNNQARKKGISHEEMVKVYNDWAEKYDEDLRPGVYNGADIVAYALAEVIPESERKDLKILDVGAGTGRVGIFLQKFGFQNMDALDPAEKMLSVLKEKGIYKNTWHDSVGKHKTQIPDEHYDAVVSAGAMAEGHIPVSAIYEMFRTLRPGGILITIIREEYLTIIEEYTGKLEECFNTLENENKVQKISRKIVPNYSFKKNGVVYVYKKIY